MLPSHRGQAEQMHACQQARHPIYEDSTIVHTSKYDFNQFARLCSKLDKLAHPSPDLKSWSQQMLVSCAEWLSR